MHCPYFVDFLELPGTFRCALRASTTFPEIGDTAVDGTEFENQHLSALAPSEGEPKNRQLERGVEHSYECDCTRVCQRKGSHS